MMSEDREGRALQRRHEDSGAVAVIVAALVIVLFGMAALGVDIAQQMRDRQDLRDTMDTAAHAGAYELPGNGAGAAAAALAMARANDAEADPVSDLWCVVASTGTPPAPNTAQIPSTCNPGPPPYTAGSYPGMACNDSICAIPCVPAQGDVCNTIRVADSATVPFAFAPAIGINEGSTGEVVSVACKGSCGAESPNPLDIVIMADRTASMEHGDRSQMKSAILGSLKTMNPEMHYVAFGTLHKSRTASYTAKSSTYGPQDDDFLVTDDSDSATKLNYNGHWDGTGDTNGDNRCHTEAHTKAPPSTATKIWRWGKDGRPDRPEPGFGQVTSGTWVPVGFLNDYLVTGAVTPTLNNASALVDGVSCLPQSIASEYGTHLAGALKGAVRYALDNSPGPGRPGTVRKVVIFETDGMPDESPAFGSTSLTSGDLSAGPQRSSGTPYTGEQGCDNLLDVAAKAKAAGIILITIGFGDAATEGCERYRNPGGESKVRDVLAAAASPHPQTSAASTAGNCGTSAGRDAENTDGDFFFCATDGSQLASIFTTAVNSVGNSIKLIKLP